MLPREERLTTREFARAFAHSRAIRHPLLQVRVHEREEASKKGMRAAWVVPKKVGKAAVRNRLRRQAREIYRLHSAREKLKEKSFDLIFLLSAQSLEASRDELSRALDEVLRRVLRL